MVRVNEREGSTHWWMPFFILPAVELRWGGGRPELGVRGFTSQGILLHRSSPATGEPSVQIAPLSWLAFWLKVHLDFNLAWNCRAATGKLGLTWEPLGSSPTLQWGLSKTCWVPLTQIWRSGKTLSSLIFIVYFSVISRKTKRSIIVTLWKFNNRTGDRIL